MAFSFNIPGVGSVGGSDLLAGAGALTALGGGIFGAIGATQAGNATAAGLLENAQVQGTNAAQARYAAGTQTQALDYATNRLEGQQRSQYGAGGVDPNTGNPLDVMGDTEAQQRLAAQNLWYAGNFAATSAGQQSAFDVQEAAAAKQAASTQATSAILGGVGGALGIVAKFLGL